MATLLLLPQSLRPSCQRVAAGFATFSILNHTYYISQAEQSRAKTRRLVCKRIKAYFAPKVSDRLLLWSWHQKHNPWNTFLYCPGIRIYSFLLFFSFFFSSFPTAHQDGVEELEKSVSGIGIYSLRSIREIHRMKNKWMLWRWMDGSKSASSSWVS